MITILHCVPLFNDFILLTVVHLQLGKKKKRTCTLFVAPQVIVKGHGS